jgi:hypothetical protein
MVATDRVYIFNRSVRSLAQFDAILNDLCFLDFVLAWNERIAEANSQWIKSFEDPVFVG